jgi:hypothetical protein
MLGWLIPLDLLRLQILAVNRNYGSQATGLVFEEILQLAFAHRLSFLLSPFGETSVLKVEYHYLLQLFVRELQPSKIS